MLWPWHPKWPLLAGWDWRLTIINKEQSARLVLFWPWGQGRIQQRVCTIVGTRWRGLLTLGWKVEVCLIIQSNEKQHALVLTLIVMGWFPILGVQNYCFYLTSIFFSLHFWVALLLFRTPKPQEAMFSHFWSTLWNFWIFFCILQNTPFLALCMDVTETRSGCWFKTDPAIKCAFNK